MHFLATLLTAPSPITPDNYKTKLYAWGDEVFLAEPPLGRAWAFYSRKLGYGDTRLDQNLARIGQRLTRELRQLDHACRTFTRSASCLWDGSCDAPGLTHLSSIANALSRTTHRRTQLLQWITHHLGDGGAAEARWTDIRKILQISDRPLQGPDLGTLRDTVELLRSANQTGRQWKCSSDIRKNAGDIPFESLRERLGCRVGAVKVDPTLKAWCGRLTNCDPQHVEQLLDLLASSGQLYTGDLSSVPSEDIAEIIEDRYAIGPPTLAANVATMQRLAAQLPMHSPLLTIAAVFYYSNVRGRFNQLRDGISDIFGHNPLDPLVRSKRDQLAEKTFSKDRLQERLRSIVIAHGFHP